MPAKSKSQQRFFGMVDAYKKGEMKNPSKKIKKAANSMSMSDVKDFAETKHKGLPEKVEEETMNKKLIRLTESDLHRIVKESVNRIINEISTDTVDASRDAALIKYNDISKKYPGSNPRVRRAEEQLRTFNDEMDSRYIKGNDARKARILKNREDRRNGKRKYKNGIGWRTED